MNLHEKAEAAQTAARKAGAMLRAHGALKVSRKSANDFVTEMDTASEKLIRGELLSRFPEDGFFGEEFGGSEATDGRWIVDPIDGTASFMRGHHGYCISIAYQYKGALVLGCVYAPDTDEMFLGIRGEGAWLNGAPIHVSEVSDISSSFAHFGYCHRHPAEREYMLRILPDICRSISDLRRYGSAAYALCCVACGRSDAFFELKLNIYDVAAGIVIAEEAGGKTSGWLPGEDAALSGNILCTNGILHEEYLTLLNREPHP